MTVAMSMENVRGWKSQFERVRRWHARTRTPMASDVDRLDIYLAFFVNCYALRDWFVRPNAALGAALDVTISNTECMRICRDLCNRSKHYAISNPSIDSDFRIMREYVGKGYPNEFIVFADTTRVKMSILADECLEFWNSYIRDISPP